jgi:hypothetical protein
MIPLSNLKLPTKNPSSYWHPYHRRYRRKEKTGARGKTYEYSVMAFSIRSMSSDEDVNPSRVQNSSTNWSICLSGQKVVKDRSGEGHAFILLVFLI